MESATEHYLTPEELVKRLKGIVKENTLANWRSRGEGPKFTKIGTQILYPINEIVAWEKARTIQQTTEIKNN